MDEGYAIILNCHHDWRINHENMCCVLCGLVQEDNLYFTFDHKKQNEEKLFFQETYSGRNLQNYDRILDVLTNLNVSPKLYNNIIRKFEKIKLKWSSFNKNDLLIYSLYVVVRNSGYEKSLNDISNASGTSIKSLMKLENIINEYIPVLTSAFCLSHFCFLLNICFRSQNKIRFQIKNDLENSELNTCRPETITVSNIVYFLRKEGIKFSLKNICEKTGVNSGTVRRYLKNKNKHGDN